MVLFRLHGILSQLRNTYGIGGRLDELRSIYLVGIGG